MKNELISQNRHGVIDVNATYTEKGLRNILNIDRPLMLDYYRKGLRYFQMTRKQPRLITGAEFFRFVEKNADLWVDNRKNK